MGDGMISHINANGRKMFKQSQDGHKTLLRMRCRDLYAALDESYIADASLAIAERVFKMPEYAAARTVFCYMSTDKEVRTDGVIDRLLADGKRVCIPLCKGDGIMEAREYRTGDALIRGRHGIREPEDTAPPVPADEIDLALIPCVACDKNCNRIGHGAGYYDRFLEGTCFVKAALCFSKLLAGNVPRYNTDIRMDRVITEDAVYNKDDDPAKVKHNGAV